MLNRAKFWVLVMLLTAFAIVSGFQIVWAEGMEEDQGPLVTDIFYNTYILDALSDLSIQSGVPIIADATLAGFVTLELESVPLEQALAMILMPGGYIFRRMNGYYLVGSPDPRNPAFRHLAETETIKLQYLTVGELRDLIPSFYNDFIRTSKDRNLVTITAPQLIIDQFKEDLAKIDVPARQVKIHILMTEVSTSVMSELGAQNLEYSISGNQEKNPNWLLDIGLELGRLSLATDFYGELLAHLQILEGEQLAKIIADPWVIVSDQKTVDLFVGERQVIILRPTDTASRIERVDVGVYLEVTPRILNQDKLEITLAPQISHLKGEGHDRMVVSRTEMATTVYVNNNQTLVLSGITVGETQEISRRVPILGQIPILRWLFGQKSEVKGEMEMLLFLTAEIL